MAWWTILLLAFLCSLPAVVLLWSAFYVGKASDRWAEEDEPQPQPSAVKPIKPKGDLAADSK